MILRKFVWIIEILVKCLWKEVTEKSQKNISMPPWKLPKKGKTRMKLLNVAGAWAIFVFVTESVDEAEKHYLEALHLTEETGDRGGSAKDYAFLGNLKFKGKSYDEAKRYFDQAAQCFTELNNLIGLAQLYLTVARLHLIDSRKESCQQYIDNAYEVSKKLGNPEHLENSIKDSGENAGIDRQNLASRLELTTAPFNFSS